MTNIGSPHDDSSYVPLPNRSETKMHQTRLNEKVRFVAKLGGRMRCLEKECSLKKGEYTEP